MSSCPALTQFPWPLTPTTWKQLATLTSQVSGSVSPYLAARLVRLLRFTSSYRAPVFLPNQPSGVAASTLYSARTQWSSLLPTLCCPPCPSVWTDSLFTLPAVSSHCPVNKTTIVRSFASGSYFLQIFYTFCTS